MRDVGARHTAQQQLIHDAQHDALTGLPNRRQFLERLDMLAASPPDGHAVLFVDIDNFKTINDECGHDTGDAALVSVASSLTNMVRPGDVVARFGGDEFTVLLQGLDHDGAASEIADRITRMLAGRRVLNGHTVAISVSVGVATAGRNDDATAAGGDLLRLADQAMYAAKRARRAQRPAAAPAVVERTA
jgi:diguanylate cyclase (GGDEF)-like protein